MTRGRATRFAEEKGLNDDVRLVAEKAVCAVFKSVDQISRKALEQPLINRSQ